jgi:hypothetical protein
MRKCAALLLITCLVISSLLVILPVSLAQTKPAAPTFTVEYPGEYAQTYLKIKNQPFTSYTSNGGTVNLYYQARYKDPYGDEWWFISYAPSEYVKQTDQEYSIINIGARDGEKIDVQVRALVGTVTWIPHYISNYGYWEFEGVEGDWSDTQTVPLNQPTSSHTAALPVNTPPVNTSTANPNPSTSKPLDTDNPSLFGLVSWICIALVVLFCAIVVLLAIIAVVLWKKKVSQFNNTLNADA